MNPLNVTPRRVVRAVQRRVRRQLRKQRARRILQVIQAKQGLCVQSGPFAGLRFPQSVLDAILTGTPLGSTLAPKLLGCYEAELHETLNAILATDYMSIVNIGAGEGFYAVGFALRCPSARVIAFEGDPLRQQLCADLAKVNGVAERIHIQGWCDQASLAPLLVSQPLLFCDCEGAELALLDPTVLPDLSACDLLIEIHDFIKPGISSELLARFTPTHRVTRIPTTTRNPATYPVLAALSHADARRALDEERPAPMEWFWLQAKQARHPENHQSA